VPTQTQPFEPLWPCPFKAAIFDFDGTLADSLGIWRKVDDLFFERRGLSYRPDYAEKLSALGFEDGARFTIETYGLTDTVQDICDEWNALGRELYRTSVHLRPDAQSYVECLQAAGIACALATTNNAAVLDALEDRIPLTSLFPVRIHGADVPRHTKDHPDIYLEAARRLGVAPSDCILFEDLPAGIQTGHSIGMTTVAVLSENTPDELAQRLRDAADYSINGWTALAKAAKLQLS
jgi:HAD superfamily hydrolase (TIGR01509 family)